jgi:glucose-6-phosphate 1-dehydrogenase
VDAASEPYVFVIFGATGDLTARKVFPALALLMLTDKVPDNFQVLGVSRSELSDNEFRQRMKKSLEDHRPDLAARFGELEERIAYTSLKGFDDAASYKTLAKRVKALHKTADTKGNAIYYLAVPPTTYEDIATGLGQADLADEASPGNNIVRLVVEKPFGHDLASAKALDATIHAHFREHQVFRIDHYMAKETVQNVLMLRFANAIFEPVWNRNFIQHVEITAAESLGVEHRAGYYDQAGVLRDMFQNHMMQLLALCAMEPPSLFEAERVRDEKSKVFRAMRPFPVSEIQDHLVLGQYGSGTINGEKVKSYIFEEGVAQDSLTPTYAMMKVFIDNWRWQGVPFYLVSGKRMAEKRTEIVIQFKEVPSSIFRTTLGEEIAANRLTLGIYPEEVIDMALQTKAPGSKMCLRGVKLHFDYGQAAEGGVKTDAYETILLDAILGDQTLFWRQDAVETCWGFLTPILIECDCPERAERLYLYRSGSSGPQQAKRLLHMDEE